MIAACNARVHFLQKTWSWRRLCRNIEPFALRDIWYKKLIITSRKKRIQKYWVRIWNALKLLARNATRDALPRKDIRAYSLLIKRIISALFGPYSWPRVPKEIMIAPSRATGNIIHEESLGTGEDGSSRATRTKAPSLVGYSPETSSRLSNRSGRLVSDFSMRWVGKSHFYRNQWLTHAEHDANRAFHVETGSADCILPIASRYSRRERHQRPVWRISKLHRTGKTKGSENSILSRVTCRDNGIYDTN